MRTRRNKDKRDEERKRISGRTGADTESTVYEKEREKEKEKEKKAIKRGL